MTIGPGSDKTEAWEENSLLALQREGGTIKSLSDWDDKLILSAETKWCGVRHTSVSSLLAGIRESEDEFDKWGVESVVKGDGDAAVVDKGGCGAELNGAFAAAADGMKTDEGKDEGLKKEMG